MLTTSERNFTVIFLVIVFAELICGSIDSLSKIHYLTKPAIVISLIVFLWTERKHFFKSILILTFLALIFSLIGDVLLLFVDASQNYFILGLIGFLMAHIFYIIIFLKQRNSNNQTYWPILILDIYAISLFLVLKDKLGDLLIPVIFYIVVILTMATTAILRKNMVSKLSYNYVILGAILFMISDSILAVNKFYFAVPFANILIMSTYAFAQYFIILGIKKEQ